MKAKKFMVALMADSLAPIVPNESFKTFKAANPHDAVIAAMEYMRKYEPAEWTAMVKSGGAYAYSAPKIPGVLWPNGMPKFVTGHKIDFGAAVEKLNQLQPA